MNFVGIDPGVNGGMAVLDYEGHVLDLCRMPVGNDCEDQIWVWANWLNTLPVKCVVWIESVSGYIGNAHTGSSMFEFGKSYGGLRMAIKGATGKLPNEVLPQDWQRVLGIEPRRKQKAYRKKRREIPLDQRGESREEFKRRLKAYAQELFPDTKIIGSTADALLIVEYGRRVYGK